jgi:hypothetical protein
MARQADNPMTTEKQKAHPSALSAPTGSRSYFKVGPKDRHLYIPDGWTQVFGVMKKGDRVGNNYLVEWEPIDDEDEGLDAIIYDHVIRPPANNEAQPRAKRVGL